MSVDLATAKRRLGREVPPEIVRAVGAELAEALRRAEAEGRRLGALEPERVAIGPDGRLEIEPGGAGGVAEAAQLLRALVGDAASLAGREGGARAELEALLAASAHAESAEALARACAGSARPPRELLAEWVSGPITLAPRTVPPADPFDARYRVLERLGGGRFGEVHRAIQLAVGREVAIKTVAAGADPERFAHEAQLASRLRHPSSVRVFDFGHRADGSAYLVTELLHGEPLAARLSRGPLDPKTSVRHLAELADALAEAHAAGVVHGAMAPRAVFLDSVGDRELVKILDLGLGASLASARTRAGGSARDALAPELALGAPLAPACDLYGLGWVAYACLSGAGPSGERPRSLLSREPPLEIPVALDRLVLSLLATEPSARPPSAARVSVELRALLPNMPEPAPTGPRALHETWIGRELGGYRLVEEIGRGAASRIYRAVHVVLGRTVAIKVLNDLALARPELHARLRREARLLGRLEHPSLVAVHDFGISSDGVPYLVTELVEGPTLERLLADEGPLSAPRAARIARQLASALALAHAHGVVHRDLKPANVVLLPGDRARLLDLGFARDDGGDAELTHAEERIGSPGFVAPEQLDRPSEAGPAADLYALGCLLHAMRTGMPPFRGPVSRVLEAQRSAPPPPLPPSEGLEGLVARLLEKRPEARPASAQDVVAELSRLEAAMLEGDEPPREEAADTAPSRPRPRPARAYLPWALAALAVGVALSRLL